MKKVLLIIVALILVVIISSLLYFAKDPTPQSKVIEEVFDPTVMAQDLKAAFNTAIDQAELPEESLVMFNIYSGNEKSTNEVELGENSDNQFYFASTIKPLYIASVIELLNIKDPETKIPLKFVDSKGYLQTISVEVSDFISFNYQADSFLTDNLVPILNEVNAKTYNDVYSEMTTNPKLVNFEYSLKDLLKYTLGPSSNWGLALIRNYFAIQKSVSEEESVNIIEKHLNDKLKSKDLPGSLIINLSTASKQQKTYNTAYFSEMETLFQTFYENGFNLDQDLLNLMKDSMKEVAKDQKLSNRRHEVKSMAKNVGITGNIVEKSGYIGFDYEAAPGLMLAKGIDKLPEVEGKRIVFFEVSSFTRIYLTNGDFIQLNYSISAPFYISKEPLYEELNQDYLVNKNKINDSLQKNIQPVLLKYKDKIEPQ